MSLLQATPALAAYVLVLTAILGLVMGSFLNCWASRIVHGESIMHGRSHCMSCGHALGPADLVPLFSWLAAKGRCRYCGAHISARYPLTELLCALVYLSIVVAYGFTLETVELLVFASALFLATLTDLDDYLIPNGCIIVALAVRVCYLVAQALLFGGDLGASLLNALLGGVFVFVPLLIIVLIADKVLGRASMGGGDLKLFFVVGCYFGWEQCLLLIIIACIVGIVAALMQSRRSAPEPDTSSEEDEGESFLQRPIPFGPSIAVASWFTLLFAAQIISWYLSCF